MVEGHEFHCRSLSCILSLLQSNGRVLIKELTPSEYKKHWAGSQASRILSLPPPGRAAGPWAQEGAMRSVVERTWNWEPEVWGEVAAGLLLTD